MAPLYAPPEPSGDDGRSFPPFRHPAQPASSEGHWNRDILAGIRFLMMTATTMSKARA